jgi:O-antigen/teichoic acid export membrane protein
MSGAATIVIGTVVATAAAYLFQLLGGRLLGPTEFAPLTILWTVQFIVMHVLYQPLEHYMIRQVELRRGIDWRLLVGCVAGATVLAALFVQLTRDLLFAGRTAYVGIAACMTLTYAGFAIVRAQLAGTRRFHAYGLATGAEGLLRLVTAGAILAVTTSAVGLAWAMVVAPLAVLAWWSGLPRSQRREPAAGLLMPMIGASVCAQLLIGGAPVAVGFLGAAPATVSIVFVTFALLRGPLWILQGLLARVLPPLTAMVRNGDARTLRIWSRRLTGAGVAAATLAGIAGAWIGPGLVALLFGPEFRPGVGFTGLVSAGVILSAVGLLTNQLLIASGRTRHMTVAWLGGLLVAAVTLAVPGEAAVRVGLAFVAGQFVAVLLLTAAIGRLFAQDGVGALDASIDPAPVLASPVTRVASDEVAVQPPTTDEGVHP